MSDEMTKADWEKRLQDIKNMMKFKKWDLEEMEPDFEDDDDCEDDERECLTCGETDRSNECCPGFDPDIYEWS